MKMASIRIVLIGLFSIGLVSGCSSTREVKTQEYAKLRNQRVFEYDFQAVWKAIEDSLQNHKVIERDPEEVEPQQLSKLKERSLETDWIYGRSEEKYVEYTVNGSPRKKYLQTRYRFKIQAKLVIGGTQVAIKTDEEIEKLKDDGSSAGYSEVDESSRQRGAQLLDRIQNAILKAP